MLNFSLKQLAYLVAVADLGSMRAAAEAEQVSQAAISMGLRDLEQRLGVQLLVRRPGHGVSVTDEGRSVALDARRVLSASLELVSTAKAPGEQLRGVLNLGCFTTLTPFYVPPLLGEFAAQHPAVRVNVMEGSQGELVRDLASGTSDLAITYAAGLGPGIVAEHVLTLDPYALLPADHPLAERPEVTVKDLAALPVVHFAGWVSPEGTTELLQEIQAGRGIVYSSANIEVVRSLVARGMGWTPVFQRWRSNTSLEGLPLASVPVRGAFPRQELVVAAAEGVPRNARSTAVTSFIRTVAEGLAGAAVHD